MSAFVSKSQQNKKEQLLHAVAVGVGLPPPDRGGSRGHRSYLCRLKEEERELKCQRKRVVPFKAKWNSFKIHCSILHALKMRRDLRGQIRVGPESHGRSKLSEKIPILVYYSHAGHTFYISSVYKVNSLAYSTACSPPHWLASALALPQEGR